MKIVIEGTPTEVRRTVDALIVGFDQAAGRPQPKSRLELAAEKRRRYQREYQRRKRVKLQTPVD